MDIGSSIVKVSLYGIIIQGLKISNGARMKMARRAALLDNSFLIERQVNKQAELTSRALIDNRKMWCSPKKGTDLISDKIATKRTLLGYMERYPEFSAFIMEPVLATVLAKISRLRISQPE